MSKRTTAFCWKTISCLLIMGGMFAGPHAGSAQDRRQSPDGQVRTLPDRTEALRQKDVLVGHVRLLGKSLDQAIADLQHADLRQFATSYKRMIHAYGQLADHIGDASQSLGDAQTQIMLASQSLADVDALAIPSASERLRLSQDVGQIRAMLIGRLSSLRAQYEASGDEQRRELLSQISGLVERIRQLDNMTASLKDNSRPLLPGLAVGQMRRQIDALEDALTEEEKVLQVVSQSARLMVSNTARQIDRTMRLLAIEARMPRRQIAQLQETRRAVQSVLEEVNDAYRRATDSAIDILTVPGETTEIGKPEDLLREADALLRGAPIAPQATAENTAAPE